MAPSNFAGYTGRVRWHQRDTGHLWVLEMDGEGERVIEDRDIWDYTGLDIWCRPEGVPDEWLGL